MRNLLAASGVFGENDATAIVAPIVQILNNVVPALIGLVAALGAIWCIILGVKYAKAEDPQAHEQAKKALINAIVGFVLIFVLLVMLRVATGIFETYYAAPVEG